MFIYIYNSTVENYFVIHIIFTIWSIFSAIHVTTLKGGTFLTVLFVNTHSEVFNPPTKDQGGSAFNIMKTIKKLIAAYFSGLLTFMCVAEPAVSNVTVVPDYPWDGEVTLTYEVSGDPINGCPDWNPPFLSIIASKGSNKFISRLSDLTATPAALLGSNGTHTVKWKVNGNDYPYHDNPVFPAGVRFTVSYLTMPEYCVLDLTGGSTVSSYFVFYMDIRPTDTEMGRYKGSAVLMRLLPDGVFNMGDQDQTYQSTVHQVTLTKPFYCAVFETTIMQWRNVMGGGGAGSAEEPINSVSYSDIRGGNEGGNWPSSNNVDATSFFGLLRSKTSGLKWDLPTEAQWEYTCRAGTTTKYSYGNSVNGNYMWFMNNSGWKAHEVGSRQSNPWGMYDFHGNVNEWCLDRWSVIMSSNPVTDPVGPVVGSARVIRGGGWSSNAAGCISAVRGGAIPNRTYANCGFRIVRNLVNNPRTDERLGERINSNLERVGTVCENFTTSVTTQVTLYVDAVNGNDSNQGMSPQTALKTIQRAIDLAGDENQILVADGVYGPIMATNLDITISSINGAKFTVIDGGNVTRCATLGNSTNDTVKATLVGFTVQNGKAEIGGGVKGGILKECIIQNNESTKEVSAEGGGGAAHSVLHRCVIRGNTSVDDSGGAGMCVLYDCLVANNLASNVNGDHSGGGIGWSTATRCTIVDNRAVKNPVTVDGAGGADMSTLNGCVVYGNKFTNGDSSDINDCTVTYSCYGSVGTGTFSGSDNIQTNPLFVASLGGNYRLRIDSPCINAGDPGTVATEPDLDGNNRIVWGRVDMGCYEVQPVDISNADIDFDAHAIYDKTAQEPDPHITYEGVRLTKNVDYTVTYSNNVNAGTATAIVSGTGKFIGRTECNFTIRQRIVEITSGSVAKVYDGTALERHTVTTNSGSFASGDGLVYTFTANPINVGNYQNTFTTTYVDSSMAGNYEIRITLGSLGIRPRPLTITINNAVKFVGDPDPIFTYTTDGLVEGDSITGAPERDPGETVGTYLIGPGTLDAGQNYIMECTNGELTIFASESVWYVSDVDGNDANPGHSPSTAFKTTQCAVDHAENNDTVIVTNGTYASFRCTNTAITVCSLNGAEATIIDGGNTNNCVLKKKSTIRGFTITNGRAEINYGGGINCDATVTVINCIITNNYAVNGGGVSGGTLVDCTISNNRTGNNGHGGGVHGSVLTNCVLASNSSYYGGGSYTSILFPVWKSPVAAR